MGIKKLFLKGKNNLSLALDKRYLSKENITYKRKIKFDNGGNDYLYFYLAHLIPETKMYNDFEYLKESGGIAYRFEDDTLTLNGCSIFLSEKTNRFYLDFGNKVLRLVDLYIICDAKELNPEEYSYLTYVLKQGYLLEINIVGGLYRFYDKNTNDIEVKEYSGSSITITIIPNI